MKESQSGQDSKEKSNPSANMRKMIYAALVGIGGIGLLKGGSEVVINRAHERIEAAGISTELANNPDLLRQALQGASLEELKDWANNLPNNSWNTKAQQAVGQEKVLPPNGNNEPEVYVGSEEMLTPPEANPFEPEANPFEPDAAEKIKEVQERVSPVPAPETLAPEISKSELHVDTNRDPFNYQKMEVPETDKIPLLQLTDNVYSFRSKETVEITSLSFKQYLKNFVSMTNAGFDLDDESQELSVAVRDDSEKVFKIFPFSQILNYKVRFGHFFAFPNDEILIGNPNAIKDFLDANGVNNEIVEISNTPVIENQQK
ncbi:MAG TPA: hypothetical protein PLQ50_01110 [Candidatus Woesebacteria bacterium]|nr:hypothetical protein [Candidatus Woesebacteria bacterium]